MASHDHPRARTKPPALHAEKLVVHVPVTLAELGLAILSEAEKRRQEEWDAERIGHNRRVLAELEAVALEHPALGRLAAAHQPIDVDEAYAECSTCVRGEADDPDLWPCDVVDYILGRPRNT